VWKRILHIDHIDNSQLVIDTEVGDTLMLKVERTIDQRPKFRIKIHSRIVRHDDMSYLCNDVNFKLQIITNINNV
jgi:hypothetical protein